MEKNYGTLQRLLLLPFLALFTATASAQQNSASADGRPIRVGIMLPLHADNGDGQRMTEYYRGVLMACDSLRADGISTDIRAWNVAEDADINAILKDTHAADRDLIIGPLYSKMAAPLGRFAKKNGIQLLVPFSIDAPELADNAKTFQVYQTPELLNETYIDGFLRRFSGCHTIVIDCNDTTSRKGIFTFGLRHRLESRGASCAVTNLKSGEELFRKAFRADRQNVVVLNTGRSPQLNVAMARLNSLKATEPDLRITLFGYTEWMLYTKYQLDNFHRFDTYIPSTFYTDPLSPKTARLNLKYRWNFHADMMQALPRFSIAGFDHAYFFIKGIHLYGSKFTGAQGTVGYAPIQTPLRFERVNGGRYQNRATLFVHFTTDGETETIKL